MPRSNWKKPANGKWQLGPWIVRQRLSPGGNRWWVAELGGEAKHFGYLLRDVREWVERQPLPEST